MKRPPDLTTTDDWMTQATADAVDTINAKFDDARRRLGLDRPPTNRRDDTR